MTYRPGRYRAGGRHEDKEEVRRKREEVRNLPRLTTSGNLRRAAKSRGKRYTMDAIGGTYAAAYTCFNGNFAKVKDRAVYEVALRGVNPTWRAFLSCFV